MGISAPEITNQIMMRSNRSHHDLISLFEHDLFGKPVSTFPDHALVLRAV